MLSCAEFTIMMLVCSGWFLGCCYVIVKVFFVFFGRLQE